MKKQLKRVTLVLFLLSALQLRAFAQSLLVIDSAKQIYSIGKNVGILKDTGSPIHAIQQADFETSTNDIPNMQITSDIYWVKIQVKNITDQEDFVLDINYPTIDELTLYQPTLKQDSFIVASLGEYKKFSERFYNHQSYIFKIRLHKDTVTTLYLKVRASEQLQLPMRIGNAVAILEDYNQQDLIFGLYVGIIIAMVLYNLFVFFSVKDKTYIFYVFYIIFVGLSQIMLKGYGLRFFWGNTPWLANHMQVFIPFMNGIFALAFIRRFLNLKIVFPKLNKGIIYFELFYCVSFIFEILQQFVLAQLFVQSAAFFASIYVLYVALSCYRKGERPAGFFLVAWSMFLIAVCIFVLRNFNILPYNNFTYYALESGSALEAMLLSFALADKINVYRKEKEISQAEALRVSQENERIVREQNIVLEEKVSIRTKELSKTNSELGKTLEELKQTQSQLVEQEKMASLGQLTAGVAHEINNPINFVLANVKPIKRDVGILLEMIDTIEAIALSDLSKEVKIEKITELKKEIDFDYLKTEIDFLLKGIDEGSSRTAEIVKGLRVFSRLDEDDAKLADINEGIDSTIVICNNLLGTKIQIQKEYAENGLIECFHGKINQVFMNMMTNAIYAVKDRYKDNHGGVIKIKTERKNDHFIITFEDNGIGMNEATQKKLFEPFFTTKPIGEGTGLGLSISFNIIKKHNGSISVESSENGGTKFIIEIPVSLLKPNIENP